MKQVILADLKDYISIVEEEQYRFTRLILQEIGLPIEDCLPEDFQEFDLNKKITLRSVLQKFNLIVLDDRDGGLKIYHENDLIAEWKKPFYCRRIDRSQIDPKKRVYLEIHLEYSSLFEKPE